MQTEGREKYFDYNDNNRAGSYDRTRTPAGVGILFRYLEEKFGKDSVQDLCIGDFPCGSGNYAKSLVDCGFSKIVLCDISDDMIDIASSKIEKKNIAESHCVSLDDMKGYVSDELVDVIICNQFYHHVIKKKGEDETLLRVLKEFRRVIRPGGILALNFCTTDHVRNSFWTRQLFPEDILDRELEHYVTESEMRNLVEKAGFKVSKVEICSQQLQSNIDKLDFRIEEVRNGDSGFANFSKDEMADWERMLEEKMNNDEDETLEKCKLKSRLYTEKYGSSVFFFCEKNEDCVNRGK